MVAGDRHGLAVLEHRRRRADLADRVDEPADHLEGGLAAAEHEGDRVERADGADDALRREVEGEQQRAEAGAAQAQLERLHVKRLHVEPRARVEQEHALRAARRRNHAPGCVEPAGGPASASSRSASRLSRSSACSIAGRSTSSTVRSTERTARLSSMIRSASSRRSGRRRRGDGSASSALAALAGELDRRRDVVRLEQRAPQRLELGEVVLAVTALGPARLRIAEAALPAAQRVGAHPQELRCSIGPDPAHVASVPAESQKCPAITSHVSATSWGVRAPLHRFSAGAASNLRQVSAAG